MARVFLYVPIIPYISLFAKLVLPAWTAGLSDLLHLSVYTLTKTIVQHKCTAVLGLALFFFFFFFVFDFARKCRRTLNLQMYCLVGAASWCVSYAPVSLPTVGHILVLHALVEDASCIVHGSVSRFFSLCGLPWLRPSRPLATWSPLAHSRLSCCSCSSSDSTKAFCLLNPMRHCVQYVLSCLTVFLGACFSAHQ